MSERYEPKKSLDSNIVAAVIGTVGTIIVAIITIFANRPVSPAQIPTQTALATLTPSPVLVTPSPTVVVIGTLSLENQVVLLRQDINSLQSYLPELERANQRLDSIDTRLNIVENTILDNPNSAMEKIVLRNDIENLKDEIILLRNEINNSKNQNYLNIALIIPIGFTLVSIALPIIRQFTKKTGNENG